MQPLMGSGDEQVHPYVKAHDLNPYACGVTSGGVIGEVAVLIMPSATQLVQLVMS